MFKNIGGKIKGLAIVLFVIGVIGSVAGAVVDLALYQTGWGVLAMFIGILLSWLSVFFVYGFGELIERAVSIDIALRMEVASTKAYFDIVRDAKAGPGVCGVCHQPNPKLWLCIAKEGAHYTERRVCPNCIKLYKNIPVNTEKTSEVPAASLSPAPDVSAPVNPN